MDEIDLELTDAVSRGDAETVAKWIDLGRVDVNVADRDGDVPLLVAAKKNQIAMLELLLQYGAWVDATDANGWTSLMEAALHGFEDVVRVLLKWGSDKSLRNAVSDTSLLWFVQYHVENLEFRRGFMR
ncbi:hypothetical protein, variant 1 [Aphanomyces astaci]|uniref:Uncharacterized protein n=1 Tax=Aphanomyces astaci TaxID=112090 RepID=W4FC75_APHAT|nr:hypothetical protein, variant 1 [Aphanomyces astaci]ETV64328.1 hypothetical protein, variant 1 [Aphanomyces astaci]|eukprot:XP_009846189.1 hypothetical protein, variant 1 [Aphanomyces astaci]